MARRVATEPPPWPTRIAPAVLALRFATELALLAALAWAAAALVLGAPLKVLLAVLAAVAGAAVWGTWVAPASGRRLRDPARLGVELVLFAAAAGALLAVDDAPAAVALAVAGAGLAVAVRLLPRGAARAAGGSQTAVTTRAGSAGSAPVPWNAPGSACAAPRPRRAAGPARPSSASTSAGRRRAGTLEVGVRPQQRAVGPRRQQLTERAPARGQELGCRRQARQRVAEQHDGRRPDAVADQPEQRLEAEEQQADGPDAEREAQPDPREAGVDRAEPVLQDRREREPRQQGERGGRRDAQPGAPREPADQQQGGHEPADGERQAGPGEAETRGRRLEITDQFAVLRPPG